MRFGVFCITAYQSKGGDKKGGKYTGWSQTEETEHHKGEGSTWVGA